MENHFYKSQVSLSGTLISIVLCSLILFFIKKYSNMSILNFVFLSIFSLSSIIIWCTTEISFKWNDKEEFDTKLSSVSEAKEELINQIKANSSWNTRTPQQEELNKVLTHSINKIELAVEEAEGATKKFIENNQK